MKKVSVITVNFNQHSVTDAMIESVLAHNTYPAVEIIVVDNGSKTNPVPNWTILYPNIKFIRSEENLGFAGGNNIGSKVAQGDYLFFVNNDTVFTPGLIETLVAKLDENPGIGMISPKIRYFDHPELIQYAGFTNMNYYTARNKCIGEFETDRGQYDATEGPTGYIHGAAMMVSKEAIRKAGLMSENFFLYYEEMDWCDRIRKAGFEIWFTPNSLIYHKESVSVGRKSALKEYFMNRNRILFIRKNATNLAKVIFNLYFCFIVVPRNLINYITNKRKDLLPYLFKAIWWNFTHSKDSKNLGYPISSIR